MGADNVRVAQSTRACSRDARPFDRVLVDPPCSGLGTLQSRPDLRWQPRRGQIAELAARQGELLRAGAAQLGARGTLVYSVCTISRREGDEVVDDFLAEHDDFTCEQRWQLLPSTDGTDGFFIALMRAPVSHLVRVGNVDEVRAIMGPECPNCHEPWLRPSARPGAYRCLYCMSRYELQSVCPNCGEHSTIVRMSTTAIVQCNHCQGSMLKPL